MCPIKIDHDAIRQLADLLNETGLTEIEIEEDDMSIRVAKSSGTVHAAVAPAPVTATAVPVEAKGNVAATAPENHPGAVKSPMVGTAYLQPQPGSPAFVNKGDSVAAGDTLLIIEAMKVMNPIKAEKSGKIVEILIDDSQPVEFDQPLIIIE